MTSLHFIEFDEDLKTRGDVAGELKDYGCFTAKVDKLSNCQEKLFGALNKIFAHRNETSFDIPNATDKKAIESFITRMWPEGKDDMCQAILNFTITAVELVSKIVVELQLPKESTGYKFRMKMNKGNVGLGCSDQEFLAVLDLHQVNGLEMNTKDGEWASIRVRPSTFLITAGKPLMEWSKAKINPPKLRVLDGEQQKYSVGLFAYDDKGKELAGSSN